jgi:hypothetical protein
MAEQLLACPHCGGEVHIRSGSWFIVHCDNCHLDCLYDGDGDGLAAWNRRSYPGMPESSEEGR